MLAKALKRRWQGGVVWLWDFREKKALKLILRVMASVDLSRARSRAADLRSMELFDLDMTGERMRKKAIGLHARKNDTVKRPLHYVRPHAASCNMWSNIAQSAFTRTGFYLRRLSFSHAQSCPWSAFHFYFNFVPPPTPCPLPFGRD